MTVSVSTSLGEMSDARGGRFMNGFQKISCLNWLNPNMRAFVFLVGTRSIGDLPLPRLGTDFQNIEKRIYLF